MEIENIITFINEAEKLKCVKRHNYTLDNNRPENSAEHSWHSALLAMLLLDTHHKEIDHLKVIKMLLIHDLVEIYAGDVFLFDSDAREDIKKDELDSINRLTEILPDSLKKEVKELWLEFEAEESEEAKFASSIDGLQPLINHNHVKPENFNPDNISIDQVYNKKSFIKDYTPNLWEITKQTIEASMNKGLYKKS